MKRLVIAFALLMTVLTVACGGSPTAPREVQTPSGPMFTEIVGTVSGGAESFKVHEGYAQAAGNVAVVLTWSGSADLDLGVGDMNGNVIGVSENSTGNREEVRFTASSGFRFNIAAPNYNSPAAVNYKITLESPRNVTMSQSAPATNSLNALSASTK